MTDSELISEYSQMILTLMARVDTLEDMVAAQDVRLEQIEKVMD